MTASGSWSGQDENNLSNNAECASFFARDVVSFNFVVMFKEG